MAMKRDRLQPESVVKKLIQPRSYEESSAQESIEPEVIAPAPIEAAAPTPTKKAKKKEEKVNVTLRLSAKNDDALSMNTGRGKREKTRSELVERSLEIVLELSDKNYAKLKNIAKERGISTGKYLNKLMDDK